jgi:hypothetical protein
MGPRGAALPIHFHVCVTHCNGIQVGSRAKSIPGSLPDRGNWLTLNEEICRARQFIRMNVTQVTVRLHGLANPLSRDRIKRRRDDSPVRDRSRRRASSKDGAAAAAYSGIGVNTRSSSPPGPFLPIRICSASPATQPGGEASVMRRAPARRCRSLIDSVQKNPQPST